jgi:hypothetical protein
VSIIFGEFVPSQKLSIGLCAAQTAATAILTFWADRMEWMRGDSNRIPPRFARLNYVILDLRNTWRSINAPTFPLNYAGLKSFHFLGEILYLIAVAVLWYLVGYFHEQEGMQKKRAVAIAIFLWGVILLCLSVAVMPAALEGGALGALNALLYTVWALVLIRLGVKNLRAFSQTQGNGWRAVAIAILLWGVILLFISIAMMPAIFKAGFFIPLGLLNALLYAVWALVLIRFGVKNFRAFSQAQGNGRS